VCEGFLSSKNKMNKRELHNRLRITIKLIVTTALLSLNTIVNGSVVKEVPSPSGYPTFSESQADANSCLPPIMDSVSRFVRFDHYEGRFAYFNVKLSLFPSDFERCYFYDAAGSENIFIGNKDEFHSDSALFLTTITDINIDLLMFWDLYERTRIANLEMNDLSKDKYVDNSPFFRNRNPRILLANHGPGVPDTIVIPCSSATVSCSGNIYTFKSQYSGDFFPVAPDPVNGYPNYGCLHDHPCPSWFFMQVSQAGDITINIEQNLLNGGAGADVDFICWGPFTSLSEGCSSGLTGTCVTNSSGPFGPPQCCDNISCPPSFYPKGNIVDCSWSGQTAETCNILNAQVGEFYILLLTNFTQDSAVITFSQTGGTGITNCNIVSNCSMLAITTDPSTCDTNTNTFSISGNIEFSNAPPGGYLTVIDSTAVPHIFQNLLAPFVSPYAYSLTGIPCDGLIHSITAVFQDSTNCYLTQTVNSPPAICPIATISGGGSICDDGVCRDTLLITFSGTPPPYTFTYDRNGIQTTITNYNGPFPYQIITSNPGTYKMDSVANASCAIGSVTPDSAVVILVQKPAAPVSSQVTFTRCGPGPITLSVTGVPPGVTIEWYDVAVGGSPIYFGTSITPTIPSDTILYVEAVILNASCPCRSVTRTPIDVRIKPIPVVSNTILSEGICSGGSPTITLQSSPSGASFSWVASNPDGLVNNYTPVMGDGDLLSEVLNLNPGVFVPGIVIYSVTPTLDGCQGTATNTFTITVNPAPTVNTLTDQVACHNETIPIIPLTGPTPGTQFNWTNSNTSVGLGSNGSVNIPSFTATNTSNIPITATITVTPSNPSSTCPGVPASFTITVNPLPGVNSIANKVFCHNNLTTLIPISGNVNGTQYTWTNSNPSIGLNASGIDTIPAFTATNTGNISITATISIIPRFTFSGKTCQGITQVFTITVNPTPTVNAVANQVFCRNESTTLISFAGSSAGTKYSWTNSDLSIGLGPNGIGNIPSFTATNSTNNPVTATITVTPSFINPLDTCRGIPETFTITVNPEPNVNLVSDKVYCNGILTSPIPLTGTVTGTVYNWTNSNPSIGLNGNGIGDILAFTTSNPGPIPVTATINISPTFTYLSKTCPGNTLPFTIIVNPTPTVNLVANQTLCHNTATTPVTFTGFVPGAQYNWTNSDPSIGIPPGGSGNMPQFTVTNTSNIPVTATITVTSSFTNLGVTCPGSPSSFTITVNPPPGSAAAISGASQVCQGQTGVLYSSGIIPNTTQYIWNYTGTGTSPPGNSDNIVIDYSLTATSGNWEVFGRNTCGDGAPVSFPVVVSLKPTVTYQVCTPLKTLRNGRKIELKGGFPLPGTYFAAEGVTYNALTDQYEFDPSVVAGLYPKNVIITYRYLNSGGCMDEKTQTITVFGLNSDIISPNLMKDLRDDVQYSYETFGAGASTQLWMTQNLNFGTRVVFPKSQTNNCTAEKFCPPSDPGCTGIGGGFYQWDELMNYQVSQGSQDLCPPGWHVPTETEWQTLIDNLDPAFPGASANALVGSELKDPAKNFKANLYGMYYLNNNNTWSFDTGTITGTMFWTSTVDANSRVITRGLNSPYNTSISKYPSSPANAFPVRCVKD
jgi:uncharacterized protein (TIGR02145 family)